VCTQHDFDTECSSLLGGCGAVVISFATDFYLLSALNRLCARARAAAIKPLPHWIPRAQCQSASNRDSGSRPGRCLLQDLRIGGPGWDSGRSLKGREMSGCVSSEGRHHQRRLRIPQTDWYSSPRFPSNTLGLPEPLWNPFLKSSPRLDAQSRAYTATYVAPFNFVELARCGHCWQCSYPHFEPICGYLGHPTHAKYRSVKTAGATHVALVVPPPLLSAWAGRPQRALVYPVPCVSRRPIILHHTSCQPAPWPPCCRHPPPPPALSYGRSERPPRGGG